MSLSKTQIAERLARNHHEFYQLTKAAFASTDPAEIRRLAHRAHTVNEEYAALLESAQSPPVSGNLGR